VDVDARAGAAVYPGDDMDGCQLLEKAEMAMRQAA